MKANKAESKVVNFDDFSQIKKKTVRGLLKKRAKKYDCKQLT